LLTAGLSQQLRFDGAIAAALMMSNKERIAERLGFSFLMVLDISRGLWEGPLAMERLEVMVQLCSPLRRGAAVLGGARSG
jgi:hypothetical protein